MSAREERQPVEPVSLTEEQLDALAAAGNRALNDHYHDDLCHCREWPESCVTSAYSPGMWDTAAFDIGLGAVLGLWESMRTDATAAESARLRLAWKSARERAQAYREGILRHVADRDTWKGWAKTAEAEVVELRARAAGLEAERHSTNEALSDAAETLRVQRDRIAELEALTPAPIQTCRKCGAGYSLGQPCSTCQFQARMASELAARQQPVEESYDSIPRFSAEEIARWQARQAEDPHDSPLHHDYALGRDLPTTHPTDAGSAL